MRKNLGITAALLALSGCDRQPPTAVVAAISASPAMHRRSDFKFVRVDVERGSTRKFTRLYPSADLVKPGTLTLHDSDDGDSSATVRVVVSGFSQDPAQDPGAKPLITRAARLAFVPQKTKLVRLGLSVDCVGKTCEPDSTCDRGACVPEAIDDPGALPDFSEEAPTFVCGDGVIAGDGAEAEECDRDNLGGQTCASATGKADARGKLSCTSTCKLDLAACTYCGDGKKNGDEECEGGDLGGQACAAGETGEVSCTAACKIDRSGCKGPVATSCSDGAKNGGETDVDCGGTCGPCAEGKACKVGGDCALKSCVMGTCQAQQKPPSCTDGLKNGGESDVDCGGACANKCLDGKACLTKADCKSGSCAASICVAAGCTDGVKNGGETDVDCGGSCAKACTDGKGCQSAADCKSGSCVKNVCVAVGCADGAKNGGETDVDCGGTCGPCADGKACTQGADCVSLVCLGSTCQVASCGDAVVQAGEECDDGNAVETDACTTACKNAACGDSFVQAGEDCDDGNNIDNDACPSSCQGFCTGPGTLLAPSGVCYRIGESIPWAGVDAVCAALGPGYGPATFATADEVATVMATFKGGYWVGGVRDSLQSSFRWYNGEPFSFAPNVFPWGSSEPSGDGNCLELYSAGLNDLSCFDGRPALCERPPLGAPLCRDGKVEGLEQCDDGNEKNNDGCTNFCTTPTCGDGVLQQGEECDGVPTLDCMTWLGISNAVGELGCDASCKITVGSCKPPQTSCLGGLAVCGSNQDCCATASVPAGIATLGDPAFVTASPPFSAEVKAFKLDVFEVTVGRFRKFHDAYDALDKSRIFADGAAAHPLNPDIAWNATYRAMLLPTIDQYDLTGCSEYPGAHTWTTSNGSSEFSPMTCVPWELAFAFCTWDGGRLPTNVEWEFAARGGEQRVYPWGDVWDASRAVHNCDPCGPPTQVPWVGSIAAGQGAWGHLDMAGSVAEWVFDAYTDGFYGGLGGCSGGACFNTSTSPGRIHRGGAFHVTVNPEQALHNANVLSAAGAFSAAGFRCARD